MEKFPYQVIPNSITINLKANNKTFASSLNGSELSANFMGDKWVATLNFETLDSFEKPEIEILQSFVWGLQGVRGKFLMWNFAKKGGPAQGIPKVKGNENSGSIVVTDGWKPNRVVLEKGDFIEINGELKMVKEDVFSGPTGDASILFMPPFRRIPADNTPVTTDQACGVFRLADDEQGEFDLNRKQEATLSIDVVEAVYYV